MLKKESVDGHKIDEMLARFLDIDVEWILNIDFTANGIDVEYDDPNDDE
jgi:hypothetical protein